MRQMGRRTMAEPMSSVEVEDVLSSVRRLVTEDMRPKPLGVKTAGPAEPVQAGVLILTQAQCVVKGKPPRERADRRRSPVRLTLTQDMAAPPFALDQIRRSRMKAVPGGLAIPDPRASVAAAGEARRLNLSAALDAIREAVDEELEDWEAQPEQSTLDETTWSEADWHALTGFVPQGASRRNDAVQDDVVPALADVRPPVSPQADLPVPQSAGGKDDMRDMVREIMREELRGLLGERVTHQMRKMVRAEISRALELRNL